MRKNILHDVAELTGPLGPFVDYRAREAMLARWLASLTFEDVSLLLKWLWDPTPIEHVDYPLSERRLEEAADEVATYVAVAAKRLRMAFVRLEFERMLHSPRLQTTALEGLGALADEESVPAIRIAAETSTREFALAAATALTSIGGPRAREALTELAQSWRHDRLVSSVLESCISECDPRRS